VLHAEFEHRVGSIDLCVQFDVAAGSCLALAGPSGAGKTTLLRLLAGTLRPDCGRVALGDQMWVDTTSGIWRPPEARRCGYLFQDYALFPHLSAWRNVAYGLRKLPRGNRHAAALALLRRFELGHRADARPRALSGGERQRVALARALATEPVVLLLDEPLSALDARTRARASRELAATLRALEIPSVLVTHDWGEAAVLGNEIGVMDAGSIVQRGTANELAATPRTAFVADFTGAVVLTGIARPSVGGLTVVELDGGGAISTTDPGSGRVAISVYPWEITIGHPSASPEESAQNRVRARVVSVTTVGNRIRVGLEAAQPIIAEVTGKAAEQLELTVGGEVVASWKATATRLVAL
jgi:molybdate transport system ATP-binding protein